MTKFSVLPSILLEIRKSLELFLENKFLDRKQTLPVKQLDRGNNSILTWNIFPDSPEDIIEVFDKIHSLLREKLLNYQGGELLE